MLFTDCGLVPMDCTGKRRHPFMKQDEDGYLPDQSPSTAMRRSTVCRIPPFR